MAKFAGSIGYVELVETAPGVIKNDVVEREYKGDILRDTVAWQESKSLNDDLTLGNRLSIIADKYAYENYSMIKYVIFDGVKWQVSNIEIKRPRMLITVRGVYNG